MGLTTSRRERRLWLCAAAILAGIAASAAFAGRLIDVLPSDALLGAAFAGALGVAVAAVVSLAVGRGGRRDVWAAAAVLAVIALIPVRGGVSALERTHLFEYGLLAVVIYEALAERGGGGRPVPFPAVVAMLAAALFGWLDEAVQGRVPERVYDLRDVGTNALAAVVAVSVVAGVRRLRRKVSGPAA